MTVAELVSIRPAELVDVDRIAEFQTVCWRDAYRGLVPQDYLDRVGPDDRAPRWRHRLLSREREIALAEVRGQLVGVVSWGTGDDVPPLELKSLYVAASFRGQRLGPQLVAHAIGDRPAHLWVYDGNERAQAFYQRHGFSDDGGRMICTDTGLRELRFTRA